MIDDGRHHVAETDVESRLSHEPLDLAHLWRRTRFDRSAAESRRRKVFSFRLPAVTKRKRSAMSFAKGTVIPSMTTTRAPEVVHLAGRLPLPRWLPALKAE